MRVFVSPKLPPRFSGRKAFVKTFFELGKSASKNLFSRGGCRPSDPLVNAGGWRPTHPARGVWGTCSSPGFARGTDEKQNFKNEEKTFLRTTYERFCDNPSGVTSILPGPILMMIVKAPRSDLTHPRACCKPPSDATQLDNWPPTLQRLDWHVVCPLRQILRQPYANLTPLPALDRCF